LREALGLWRGPPLSDFRYDSFAQAEIARLSELHIEVVEQRIEAELALGREAGLIGELEGLVREHPLRERLCGQLMLALYRAGRQADALAAYRELSGVLREELGLRPSESLRQLERAILGQDPSLSGPAAQAPAAGYLPVAATPFLGRTRELGEVVALLRGAAGRLVTLTGAGGSGKTRLAVRVAQECAREYVAGAWFVGFSDITDPELIAPVICQALGLAEQPDLTPAQRLEGYLRERELLLVLDNLEQLAPGVGVLGDLLAGGPGVRMLVTSREPLRLAGEQQYEVPVLEVEDAIELFTARARTVAPNLIIERDWVGAVCERLDRLPLAIELAAARAKVLSPAEILHRLERRLPVLGSGPRDAPQRQRTLLATIDWSYELLTGEQQRLLARLSVFAGGWKLEAAEAVCDAELDTLEALVDRSLVRSDGGRHWMLQTLREYALDKLARSDERDAIRRRHAQYFVEFVKQAQEHLRSVDQTRWYARLRGETDNLRAVLAWSLENDTGACVDLVATLRRAWTGQGQLHELIAWLEHALANPTPTDLRTRAIVLREYGVALDQVGEYGSAWESLQGSLELFRALGDRQCEADVLLELSGVAHDQGLIEEALALATPALASFRELGERWWVAQALHLMGECFLDSKDFQRASATLKEALATFDDLGDRDFMQRTAHDLGDLALDQGNAERAGAFYRQGLTTVEAGNQLGQFMCMAGLACVAGLSGDAYTAGRLWGAVETAEKRLRTPMHSRERKRYLRILDPLTKDPDFQQGQEAGRDLSLGQAVHHVLSA
jgi:predicted ATPase